MTDHPRWPVIVGALTGVALAGFGVHTLLAHASDTRPATVARWVIGLAIVQHVAAAHGGSVEVVRPRPRGAAFTLRIPEVQHA